MSSFGNRRQKAVALQREKEDKETTDGKKTNTGENDDGNGPEETNASRTRAEAVENETQRSIETSEVIRPAAASRQSSRNGSIEKPGSRKNDHDAPELPATAASTTAASPRPKPGLASATSSSAGHTNKTTPHGEITVESMDKLYKSMTLKNNLQLKYGSHRLFNAEKLTCFKQWDDDDESTSYMINMMKMPTPMSCLESLFGLKHSSQGISGEQFCFLAYLIDVAYKIPNGKLLEIEPECVTMKKPLEFIQNWELERLARFWCAGGRKEDDKEATNGEKCYTAGHKMGRLTPPSNKAVTVQTGSTVQVIGSKDSRYSLKWAKDPEAVHHYQWNAVENMQAIPGHQGIAQLASTTVAQGASINVASLYASMGCTILPTRAGPVPRPYTGLPYNHRSMTDTAKLVKWDNVSRPEQIIGGIASTYTGKCDRPCLNEGLVTCPYMLGEMQIALPKSRMESPIGYQNGHSLAGEWAAKPMEVAPVKILYSILLDRDWDKHYVIQREVSNNVSKVSEWEATVEATLVYATLLSDFDRVVNGLANGTKIWELYGVLCRKISWMTGDVDLFQPCCGRKEEDNYLRARVLLRVICNIVGGSVGDTKLDGNGRTAALVYSALRMNPESTPEDMEYPYRVPSQHWSRGPQWNKFNTSLVINYVFPCRLVEQQERMQRVSSSIQMEKSISADRSLQDVVLGLCGKLFSMNSEELREAHSLPELCYEESLHYEKQNTPGGSLVHHIKRGKRVMDMNWPLSAKQGPRLTKVRNWLVEQLTHEGMHSIQKDLNSLKTLDAKYSWRMPQLERVFEMFFVLFGQYLVYDVLAEDTTVRRGWLKCIQAVSETNGRAGRSQVTFRKDKDPQSQSLERPSQEEDEMDEFIVSEVSNVRHLM